MTQIGNKYGVIQPSIWMIFHWSN